MPEGCVRDTARRVGAFLACAGAATCAVLAAGCGDTAIVLELQGGLSIPDQANALRVSVTVASTGGSEVGQVFTTDQILLNEGDSMPFVLAIEPGAAPLGPVTVNVNAYRVTGEGLDAATVLVASGSAVSAFENQRVNRAVVVLGRAACGDDALEDLDDAFFGAPINAAKDGAQPDLTLCPGDGFDRFNFVVPENYTFQVGIDRFVSDDPAIMELQAVLRCQGPSDPEPVTLASGPVSYGAFLLIDTHFEARTCILDLARPVGAPDAKVAYGFVARVTPDTVIPPTCFDDMLDEPIGITVPAAGTAPVTGPPAVLCPQDEDDYDVSAPASRLLSVSIGASVSGGLVSGALECDPSFGRGSTTVFPVAGRTMPGPAPGTTTSCDLALLNLETSPLSYAVEITSASLAACLPDQAGANGSTATAYDLAIAGVDPVTGGRVDGLVVCAGQDDYFTYTFGGLAGVLIFTVRAPYYLDGDVDLCVTQTVGMGPALPGSCSQGVGDTEVLSVPATWNTTYSIQVHCFGGPCGNVYSLEVAQGM
jgi:hypothetical protein